MHNEFVSKVCAKLPILADSLNNMLNQYPEKPGVIQGNEVRSYQQLSEAAENIAAQLGNMGITAGQRLAVDLPRSIALYEMILGCLIAGISFVSLPRGFNPSELTKEAQRAHCAAILSNSTLLLSDGLKIDDIGSVWKLPQSSPRPRRHSSTGEEIYCVRTSGTTGAPKVIPINSGQLSAFLENSQKALAVPTHAKWLWIHDLSFDFSIWETFGCLRHCGCLVVLDEHTKHNPQATLSLMAKTGVNILSGTPSEFRYIFLSQNTQITDELHLTDLIIGGEKLSPNNFLPLFDKLISQDVRWIHVYGPTETTVVCSSHIITEADFELESIPIGKPFQGMEFQLLSKSNPMQGELHIRGAQVFDGYDNGQLLTDGYSTGDICRLDEQGRFVFVGRTEGYQKINGFRVEPYEIEEHLESHPNVDEAVVWVENSDDQSNYLLACVKQRRGTELSTRDLRMVCAKLPPYLRPTQYLLLNDGEWPINERGKTDRKRLRSKVLEEQISE